MTDKCAANFIIAVRVINRVQPSENLLQIHESFHFSQFVVSLQFVQSIDRPTDDVDDVITSIMVL